MTTMPLNEFESEVISGLRGRLGHLPGLPDVRTAIPLTVYGQLYTRGFTVKDAIAYLMLTEELNPDLNEDVALARMAAISRKYPEGVHPERNDGPRDMQVCGSREDDNWVGHGLPLGTIVQVKPESGEYAWVCTDGHTEGGRPGNHPLRFFPEELGPVQG